MDNQGEFEFRRRVSPRRLNPCSTANNSLDSPVARRMSPRLHLHGNGNGIVKGNGFMSVKGNDVIVIGNENDVTVNENNDVTRRMSPRLHHHGNVNGNGTGIVNANGIMSVKWNDVTVNENNDVTRRMSPRLHLHGNGNGIVNGNGIMNVKNGNDVTANPTGNGNGIVNGNEIMNVKKGNYATVNVNGNGYGIVNGIGIMNAKRNNATVNENIASVNVNVNVNVNGNDATVDSVTDIQQKLSPSSRTRNGIVHNQGHEDASKDSVIQRRLSPRLHQPNTTKSGKRRLQHYSSTNVDTSAKRNKPLDSELDTVDTSIPDRVAVDVVPPLNNQNQVRIKETLRIFNTHYLQAFQDEKERKQREKDLESEDKTRKRKKTRNAKKGKSKENGKKGDSFRPDLIALSKMRLNGEILHSAKRIGPVPGVDVGYQFYTRAEMVAVGVHSHWLNGIDFIGESKAKAEHRQYTLPIAVAVVMSGQYEDDQDNSDVIHYTGQGGHNLTGNKRQIKDQVMEGGNLALKRGKVALIDPHLLRDMWGPLLHWGIVVNSMGQSIPVRVIRGHLNAASYTGKIYSYDGLYKVVDTEEAKGQSGHLVYKFHLKRLGGQPKLMTEQVEFVKGSKTPALRGLVCPDITNGQEGICIPVTNIYDDPPVGPAGFTYIKSLEVAKNVKLPPNATGCTCKGDCSNSTTCACAKLNGSDIPYVRNHGGRLVEPKDIVFECGPGCGCGPLCLNRTSQRGIRYHLEVYRTLDKGWAVRTRDYIPSGAPVCEYIGVLSRSDELDNVAENDYIFEIDCLHTMNEIEGRERRGNLPVSVTNVLPKIDEKDLDRTPEFSIDAGSRGNFARFINHSCEPNLFVQCILSSHHDLRLARVVLFAADNIHPMQELTYDYGYALDSVVGADGKIQELPCFCGTAECRKRLY